MTIGRLVPEGWPGAIKSHPENIRVPVTHGELIDLHDRPIDPPDVRQRLRRGQQPRNGGIRLIAVTTSKVNPLLETRGFREDAGP